MPNVNFVADSTQSTGLKWAAAASGGGMTLINTGGTTLSGTTTTIGSIPSTYKELVIYVLGFKPTSIDTILSMRFNGDTGTTYFSLRDGQGTTGSTGQTFDNSLIVLNNNGLSNDADAQYNSIKINVPSYADTSRYKIYQSFAGWKYAYAGATQNWGATIRFGMWSSSAAISSVAFTVSGGWSAGTAYVYGVN